MVGKGEPKIVTARVGGENIASERGTTLSNWDCSGRKILEKINRKVKF